MPKNGVITLAHPTKKNAKSSKTSKGKIAGLVVVSFFSLILFVAAGGLLYINGMLNKLQPGNFSGNESLTESEIFAGESRQNVSDSISDIHDTKSDYHNAQSTEMLHQSGVENILLIGSDRRNTNIYGNSDSMMIATINHDTGKLHLTSLMRAMYVNIPKSSGSTWSMLNAAYAWGGPELLVKTVEQNFRVDIDHYIVVDFTSFTSVVDAVGGGEITLQKDELRWMAYYDEKGRTFSAGTQKLDGAGALAYSRIRYAGDDFVRTGRQRTVMEAILKKAKTLSAPQLLSLANTVIPMVSTDMSKTQSLSYVSQAGTLLSYPMDQLMLPVENEGGGKYQNIMFVGGMEMYKVNFTVNIKHLHAFILS